MTTQFRLLGAVGAQRGGRPLDLGHARQQCVLVALLVDANAAVSAEQLIDRVWGARPARGARNTLHTYLARIRRVLDAAPDVTLERRSSGYQLTVAESSVDLHWFRQLVGAARSAGDDSEALRSFELALGLWRGEPFAGLDTPWLNGLRATLEKQRLAAELDRTDVALRLGLHAELLPELSNQLTKRPLDERLAGQLMLALYRSGRQADALETFSRTRRALAEELGVDPGHELRQTQERILRGDAGLAGQPQRDSHAGAVRRNYLPGDVADFTGRGAELDRLLSALPEGGAPGTVVITAIDGMAGIGKTMLAVHAAHRLAGRYPDAQLFIDLHGHTAGRAATDPLAALDTLLGALGVPGREIPHDLEARAAMWRAELAGREALVVLDNAANAAQVRPLLPGTARCLTLITSRRRLVDLEGTGVLTLDLLPRADAITLFTRIVGDHRAGAHPAATDEVAELCGDLPLAIRVAAARLRTRPTWTVRYLADRLRDRRPAELSVGDRSVAAAFALSYEDLDGPQQRLFRLLGLHPGQDFDAYAAASLAHLDLTGTERLLEDLVDVHLLSQLAPGRYCFHDLIRDHARATAGAVESVADQRAALARLVDHYLLTAAAYLELDRFRESVELPRLAAGVIPRPIADRIAALAWFETEHANLLAAQRLAFEEGWHAPVWQLAWSLTDFHYHGGRLREFVDLWQLGVAATQQLDDAPAQVIARYQLALAYVLLDRHAEAMPLLEAAGRLADQAGDRRGLAGTHSVCSLAWGRRGDWRRAVEHSEHALHNFRVATDPVREAHELNQLGWWQAQLGQYEQAREHCVAALEAHRRHGDRGGEGVTLDTLGYIAQHTGQYPEAVDYYERAVALFGELGSVYHQADSLVEVGNTHDATGDHEPARAAWQRALALYEDQHRLADADRVRERL